MNIIRCDQSYATNWDSFLDGQESASFYHLFDWKQINEQCFGHETYYLAALERDQLCGVLPLIYINSLVFGKILCSMPFVNFGGVCAKDQFVESQLIGEAKTIVRGEKIKYVEFRNLKKLSEELPTSEHKISMTLELQNDPDELWNKFKSKQRTEIRRAYKNGLHIEDGRKERLDIFYEIISRSWHALGTPIYQKRYFSTILDLFPNNTRIFIVFHNNQPIAAAFNGYYRGTVEGMWLGIIPEFRKHNPVNVLYWEMVKHACQSGYKNFHLGRSSANSGAEFFKKKWNAHPQQLYWQYYLGTETNIPQLNVNNPKYKFAINSWKKLPYKFTTFLGPFIAKNIP